MKTTKISGLILCILCGSPLYSQPITSAGIEILNSNITSENYAFADDGYLPIQNPALFDDSLCFLNTPLQLPGSQTIFGWLPRSLGAAYCPTYAYETDVCINTTAESTAGCEVGASSDGLQIWMQMVSKTFHLSELFGPYSASAEGNLSASFEIVIPQSSVQGTNYAALYYNFTGWLEATSESESSHEDPAWVFLDTLMLNGVDLIQAGSFPGAFATSPGVPGGSSSLVIDGFVNFTPDVPFIFEVSARSFSALTGAGVHVVDICGDRWLDLGSASFSGMLTLSLVKFSPKGGPFSGFFSVDIGGDTELSDPMANGTEYFDPGDGYRVNVPNNAFGGANGLIDDATFFFGNDIAPTPPDPAIPSLTAAPVGSGLPLSDIQTSYFNMDGLSRAPFVPDATADPPGPLPLLAPDNLCPYLPRFLYMSFDDDAPGHYANSAASVPANSTYNYLNHVYGSDQYKDEVVEVVVMPSGLGGVISVQGLASETDINPSLGPNPPAIGPGAFNDDVDALSFGFPGAGECAFTYISVDHEATGGDLSGLPYDPGTIYRVSQVGGGSLIPVVIPSHLGLPDGVDIDAFEFSRVNYIGEDGITIEILALLFSVDVDDPLTSTIDESGGLNPNTLYISIMDGTFALFDSTFSAEGNIDALSISPNPLSSLYTSQTCNPFNFIQPPANLNVSVGSGAVDITWDPYPFALKCQVAGNRVSQTNDQTFLVNATSPPAVNSFSIPTSQLLANQTYRVRVRCGCSFSPSLVSPFTAYVFFTLPPGPSPLVDYFENESTETVMSGDQLQAELFPNPADEFINVKLLNPTSEPVLITIFNAKGQEIRREMLTGGLPDVHRLNLSELASGWYSTQVRIDDRFVTMPFLKK